MPLLSIFGKPQSTEAVVIGPGGRDTQLEVAATQWAPPAEPLGLRAGERLYRISRHALNDRVWTWVGCYGHADAIGSSRDGGFYGAAILSSDEHLQGDRTLSFLQSIMPTLADSLLKDGRFNRNVSGINPQLDTARLQDCVGGAAILTRGLSADAFGKLFVETSDQDEVSLARLIAFGQEDARCRGESAIYMSAAPRLVASAGQSLQTAGITVTTLHQLQDRPQPTPPTPPPSIIPAGTVSAPIRRSLSPAALPEMSGASMHSAIMDDVRRLLDQRFQEYGHLQSERRQARKPAGWKQFALSFAGTAVLALLFIIAVFLALPYAGSRQAPAQVSTAAVPPPLDPAISPTRTSNPEPSPTLEDPLLRDQGSEELTAAER